MRIGGLIALAAAGIALTACASGVRPQTYAVSHPWAGLKLTKCRGYGNFSECQLVQTTVSAYGGTWLGPVQQRNRRFQALGDLYQYQVTSCYEIDRVNPPLPNYVCTIVGYRTGADAGSVFVKGGTAVKLAKYLGNREQLRYRRERDPWDRKG